MANIKNVTLTKSDMHNPVTQLVRGDKRTSGLIMNIDRFDGSHDLSSGMIWSINVMSSNGESDIISFKPQVTDLWLIYEWEFPPVVSASEGMTMFNVMALNASGEKVWQSGKRYISVTGTVDATGGYTEKELTVFQEAVISTTHRIEKMQSDMDVYEVRIDNATNEAEQAVRDANTAINNANTATEMSNAATARATTAAANAENATTRANTAASNADSATARANTATSSANTATANAIAAKNDAVTATTRANAASDKLEETIAAANTATQNANSAAGSANTAAENATDIAEELERMRDAGEFDGKDYIITDEDLKEIEDSALATVNDHIEHLIVTNGDVDEYTKLEIKQNPGEVEILTTEDMAILRGEIKTHTDNTIVHITAEERELWNSSVGSVDESVIEELRDMISEVVVTDGGVTDNTKIEIVGGNDTVTLVTEDDLNDIKELFQCTYGTTTYSDVVNAVNDGKLPYFVYNSNMYTYCYNGNNSCMFSSFYASNAIRLATVGSSNTWAITSKAYQTVGDKTSTISTTEQSEYKYPSEKAAYNFVMDSAFFHNIPRAVPKDITTHYNDGSLWKRINGTDGYSAFEDIHVGDYFKMSRAISAYERTGQYQTTGSQYVTVASINGLYGIGDSSPVNYNHLVMVPGQGFGGTQHFGRSRMNSTNTTNGGYVGSEMFTTTIGEVVTSGSTSSTATINQQLYAEFGSHLKTTRELLSNSINSTGYNRFGSNSGCSNNWAWTSCQAVLMSEVEVYGSTVWSSSGYDTGTGKKQFELFANNTQALNNRTAYYWLKDVASSAYFCVSSYYGNAYYNDASRANACVRPRFVIS